VRKLLSKKWFIVVLVVLLLIATVIFGLLPGSPVKQIFNAVSYVVSPVQNLVKGGGDIFSDFYVAITDGIAIRNENEELKAQIASLQYELTQNEEAAIRYEELKDAFHIKDTFSNYDIYGASVLSREADEWFSIIRVRLGTTDGIDFSKNTSYAVVDVEMNLVGRVIEISDTQTKILPIRHEGFVVSCKVNEVNGAKITVSGDAGLKKQGLCLVTGIEENSNITPGTQIVTSGEGGLFPEGIPVGVIETVDNSNPLNITATLRPYSDIAELSDVFIMVQYEENTDNTESTEEVQ